jgi:WXG100 family type VII secretion target
MAVQHLPVTTSGMNQARRQFEAASMNAASQIQRVSAELASLRESWNGDAAVKFGHAMSDWEEQFGIIVAELNHMIEVMGGHAEECAVKEKSAVRTASAWAGGLSGM